MDLQKHKTIFDDAICENAEDCNDLDALDTETETLGALRGCIDAVPEPVLAALKVCWENMFVTGDDNDYTPPSNYKDAVEVATSIMRTRLANEVNDRQGEMGVLDGALAAAPKMADCLQVWRGNSEVLIKFFSRLVELSGPDSIGLLARALRVAEANNELEIFERSLAEETKAATAGS